MASPILVRRHTSVPALTHLAPRLLRAACAAHCVARRQKRCLHHTADNRVADCWPSATSVDPCGTDMGHGVGCDTPAHDLLAVPHAHLAMDRGERRALSRGEKLAESAGVQR
jgi:hypothetical protein